jgi:RNA 2',3'-cyclic 3'-phosphodiesterase
MTGRRMFVAVWPPPSVMAPLGLLGRPKGAGLRWTAPHQWHVTLRFLGSVQDEAAEDLRDVWHRFDVDSTGFVEAVLGPATAQLGDGILVVPVAGLEALARQVGSATAAIGQPPDLGPFTGHVTLARARGVDLSAFAGTPVSARWTVTEITLVVSHSVLAGSRYEIVDRRPLPSSR